MRNAEKRHKQTEGGEEGAEPVQAESTMKQATRRSGYSICLTAKLG